ncbi:MAG: hypothetical protein LIO46_01490, partial [Clostridiales bacterium]|nr:hypothetical protein [Clostridiales bacterium]
MKNRLLHRWVSTLLALCLVTPLAAGTAGAQEKFDGGTDVTYDESVYVTLDAYGNREQLSVVKGVDLNGNTEFYDYGDYERVQDMTGRGEADLTPQGVRWDVTGGEGKRLYFEAVPRTDSIALPWSFQVSYKLNGVPAKAESLAGASGMVEIAVHCIPDDSVEDYYRNNMMLQLAALADMEQVLSIEAPGAQIQAMGKYKAVLFAALPGEEITFQLRIGTEDFSFLGMLMLMEPATLGQMAQLKELRQLMDTVEEIPAGLFGGMGGLLGSLQGIGGQLEQAGGGFAQLQDAYQSVQAYAGDIQVESGALLEALSGLSGNVTALVNGVNNASSTLRGLDSGLSGLLKGGLSEELEALDAARLLEQYQADYDTVKTQADTFSREVAAISSLSGTVEGQLRDTGLD